MVKKKRKKAPPRYEPIKLSLGADEPRERPERTPRPSTNRAGNETRNLLLVAGVIVLIFAVAFFVRSSFVDVNDPQTLTGLHETNLGGEETNESYTYNGFSIVKVGDLWYSQVQKGDTVFDVSFNHGPREVEDIPLEGTLSEGFITAEQFWVTFDPLGEDLRYIAVANYGLSRSLSRAFGLNVKAGCSRNETDDCASAEIVTCEDEDRQVFFFKEANETKVIFDGDCVTIQGKGEGIIKAKDRLLLRWYGIME